MTIPESHLWPIYPCSILLINKDAPNTPHYLISMPTIDEPSHNLTFYAKLLA